LGETCPVTDHCYECYDMNTAPSTEPGSYNPQRVVSRKFLCSVQQ